MLNVIASIYALYTVWLVSTLWAQFSIINFGINFGLAVACCFAAVGLWMRKRWARYFVYSVSMVMVGFMSLVFIYAAWRGAHYDSTLQAVIGSIPGICIILFAVFSSIYVARNMSLGS